MEQNINVHVFDGKVKDLTSLPYENNSTISLREVPVLTEVYKQQLYTLINHPNWFTILNEWGSQNNYDGTNNIHAEPLVLLILYLYKQDNDILVTLLEQLNDMHTGMCPQGRVIRLLQTISAFK